MISKPKISVLMPVYKTKEEYLREAIESILAQTFTDFEFLILDDCPDNPVEKIVKSYSDARIKYSKNEKNLGISASRNKLIDMAKGEYLAVMDHDDVAESERFAEEVLVLDRNLKIGVVGSWFKRFPNERNCKNPETNEQIIHYLMQNCAVLHPTSMIRKSALGRLRYEEDFTPSEDYALWCRLIGKTEFYNIQKVLFNYREHATNTSKTQADKIDIATKKIQQFVRKENPKIWNDFAKKAKHIVRMKLFGIIPCGCFHQRGNQRKGILKILPFIQTKTKLEGWK